MFDFLLILALLYNFYYHYLKLPQYARFKMCARAEVYENAIIGFEVD